ncbi:MAG: protein translocase subunit SecDF, partial [Bacteroidota bacterium]
MLLVTAYQYFFIIPTNAVEADAAEYAQEESGETEGEDFRKMRAIYLDSISDQTVFKIPLIKSFTYQDLKAQQLNLGLDLKGGMSVVLQVDLREFIRNLARNSKDPTLEDALNKASQAQANAQDDYIALFADAWQEVRGNQTLAPIFSRNDALRDEIPQGTSDASVILLLREQADEAVASTYELLKKRIDQLGVVQPNV